MTVLCQFINDEEECDQEAERVLREKGRGGLRPWRNRVPFCSEHREYLLTDPSVEIAWEDQGSVDEFPADSLYQGVRSA